MATLRILMGIAVVCATAEGAKKSGASKRNSGLAWSAGRTSWRAVRDHELWDQPNACDPVVLQSSAPLTVLFGLSSVWERIRQRREADGLTDKPLEVHILGASYPFEGRSNWSMLAAQRPPDVPGIRVRLVLGTPFQSDNVPPLAHQPNSLLQKIKPVPGRWSNKREEVICPGGGQWGTDGIDKQWNKEEVCRDHGNGLEVICIEKLYQDVRTELPQPDFVAMFSPGFPQLGRRSWDGVLIDILSKRAPLMISDVVALESWGFNITDKALGPKPVQPGGRWNPAARLGEDFQTWLTMKKYGALKLRARRNPFPILHREDDGFEKSTMAKNAIVQIYEGYRPNKKPTLPISAEDAAKYEAAFNKINWKQLSSEDCPADEIKYTMKWPTSRAFDNAVRDTYKDSFRRKAKFLQKKLNEKQRDRLRRYGLLELDEGGYRKKRWSLKEWVNILSLLGCDEY